MFLELIDIQGIHAGIKAELRPVALLRFLCELVNLWGSAESPGMKLQIRPGLFLIYTVSFAQFADLVSLSIRHSNVIHAAQQWAWPAGIKHRAPPRTTAQPSICNSTTETITRLDAFPQLEEICQDCFTNNPMIFPEKHYMCTSNHLQVLHLFYKNLLHFASACCRLNVLLRLSRWRERCTSGLRCSRQQSKVTWVYQKLLAVHPKHPQVRGVAVTVRCIHLCFHVAQLRRLK